MWVNDSLPQVPIFFFPILSGERGLKRERDRKREFDLEVKRSEWDPYVS